MTQMEDIVRQSIATVCDIDPAQVSADSKLSDLGVDSLAAAEMLVDIEIRIGKELPIAVLRELDGAETVGLIAARLDALFGTVEQG
jgi:acyl carrier protein